MRNDRCGEHRGPVDRRAQPLLGLPDAVRVSFSSWLRREPAERGSFITVASTAHRARRFGASTLEVVVTNVCVELRGIAVGALVRGAQTTVRGKRACFGTSSGAERPRLHYRVGRRAPPSLAGSGRPAAAAA